MRIATIDIDPPLLLAPMEGVTDLTFRRLVRQIGGCGLTVTEFVPARGLSAMSAREQAMVAFDEDEHPVAIQIFGREPDVMAEGARVAEELGADIVDLNMGCPSKRVCARSGGSALMREPELARDIVRAVRAAVSIPFTVKMRAGWDRESVNAPDIAWMCQEEGVDALAVHWRTREEKYGGVRDLSAITQVVDRVSIPVSANGDIVDVASARDTAARTGAAGLMIGRGAIRDPWLFERIRRDRAGEPPLVVDAAEKRRVLLGYCEALRSRFRSDKGSLGRMKKIARYFTEGLPHGELLRQPFFRSQSVEQAYDEVERYFAMLERYEAGEQDVFEMA